MEIHLNRSEKIIAILAVSAAVAFILMFMQINLRSNYSNAHVNTRAQINYEMARPEEAFSEYSLSGREIDQVYEGLQKKEIAKALETKSKKPQTEAEKKSELAKKKDEAAKKLAVEAQSNQNTAQVKKLAEQSQKNTRETESDFYNKDTSQDVPYSNSQVVAQKSYTYTQAQAPLDSKAKAKKTFAEWRSLVFSQPTRENLNLFLEAYRKNEVTSAEMQALAQDLIDQNDDKLKGLGLYALRAAPSLASLSQLVHIETNINATFKTYVDQAYLTYLQPQNVEFLNQALQTKDKTLVLKSLNLLGVNLQKVSKGDYSSLVDPRNRRDADSQNQFSMNTYKGLIPALTAIGSSQDQELAGLAQQVVSFIQTTNNVAVN
jgi:hypothetical protein